MELFIIALSIALIVLFIWAATKKGMILGFVQTWGDKYLPEWAQKMVYDCPICMTAWYGSVAYWIGWGGGNFFDSASQWILVILIASGINTVFAKIFPD